MIHNPVANFAQQSLLDTFSSPDGQKPECRLSNNRGKNLFTIQGNHLKNPPMKVRLVSNKYLSTYKVTVTDKVVYVIVCIRNQSLYIRTAIISVIIYNDCKKLVCIYNDQLKPVLIYNDQQFSLPFHKQTSLFV